MRYFVEIYGGPFTRICWPGETTLNIIGSRDEHGVLTLRHLHAPECAQWGKHDPSGKTPCRCAQTVFWAGPAAVPDVEVFLQRLHEVTGVEPTPIQDDWDQEDTL